MVTIYIYLHGKIHIMYNSNTKQLKHVKAWDASLNILGIHFKHYNVPHFLNCVYSIILMYLHRNIPQL